MNRNKYITLLVLAVYAVVVYFLSSSVDSLFVSMVTGVVLMIFAAFWALAIMIVLTEGLETLQEFWDWLRQKGDGT